MVISAGNSETEVSCTVHMDLIRNGHGTILIYFKSWVCKLRAAGRMQTPSLYYAARGHISNFCMHYKNYTINQVVGYTTYFYLPTCDR
jgi:hypothetical protein